MAKWTPGERSCENPKCERSLRKEGQGRGTDRGRGRRQEEKVKASPRGTQKVCRKPGAGEGAVLTLCSQSQSVQRLRRVSRGGPRGWGAGRVSYNGTSNNNATNVTIWNKNKSKKIRAAVLP